MKKRIFTLLLCLVLALSLPGYAQMAAQGYDTQGLDRFSSFALDESTGEWSVSDPTFEALLDAVAAEEGKNAMKDGFAVFQLRLSGNEQTGTLRPEIEINFFASEPIGVRAVSLLAGGKRFDVNAQAQSISAGGVRGERVVLPMRLADDLELIAGAEEITLVLYGETDVYRTEISATEKARNARERLEKASLGCFDLLETLESFHVDSYDLWDRSWSEWNAALDYDLYYSSYAAESIELITLKDRGEDVEKLQQLLIAAGFYVGEEEYEFKEKTAEAVARAQEYYGMVVTGAADEGLISCLQGGD
ncbi:MAG: peptidoglycan-binding domain-containing protein, partial [Eubacteriales bacterium]|nr:peptidoglycan-binding domain-containing protein [Eubacteriales bacterium]